MERNLLFFILIFLLKLSSGQDSVMVESNQLDMITNRPGATEASHAVYQEGFQIEAGFEYGKIPDQKGVSTHKEYIFLPNIGFQYGVSPNVELRIFTTNYATRSYLNSGYTQFVYELANVNVGAKINLTEAKRGLPEMAILIDQGISTRPANERSYWPTRGLLAWSYSLPSNFSLAGNFGYINQKEYYDQYITYGHSFTYTLNFGYGIKDNLGVFAEVFGIDRLNKDRSFPWNFDGGVWYRLNNKFQIDASMGYGFDVGNYYVNVGMSKLFLR